MSDETITSREIRRTYREQMRSFEWKEFSAHQIEKADHRCFMCGEDDGLQVHHLVYRQGRMAWEYDSDEVRVLCRECHTAVHVVADAVWVELLRYEPHALEMILKRLKTEYRGDLLRSVRGAIFDADLAQFEDR